MRKTKTIHMGQIHNSRYIDGQGRCQTCDLYVLWNLDSYCPCCGTKLRTRPRSRSHKEQYKKIIIQQTNPKIP